MSMSKNRRAARRAFQRDIDALTTARPTVVVSAKMSPEQLRQHLMLGTRASRIPSRRATQRGGRGTVRRLAIDAG